MKSYKVTDLFITLWGILGLWILLGGLMFSIFAGKSMIGGVFFSVASLIFIYLLISGKSERKLEYTIWELAARGLMIILVLVVSSILLTFIGSIRPYLIVYMGVIIILLLLMVAQLSKSTPYPD